jgi:hypothetical protein
MWHGKSPNPHFPASGMSRIRDVSLLPECTYTVSQGAERRFESRDGGSGARVHPPATAPFRQGDRKLRARFRRSSGRASRGRDRPLPSSVSAIRQPIDFT